MLKGNHNNKNIIQGNQLDNLLIVALCCERPLD